MKRVLPSHRVITGIEYEVRDRQDQWNTDVTPSPVVYLDDRRSTSSWAVYVQDEIAVSPIFRVYAGIRHDRVSTFGGSTNPRLAAVIEPIEKGSLKLLYGRAFRAPTVYEMHYEDPPSVLSNPDLKPEEIETYELVYEQDLGNGLRFTAGRYSYRIVNLITQTYDGSGIASFQNQEKAEATGTEVEIRKTGENGIDGRLSYSYQRAVDPNTGRLLTNAPEHLAKMNVHVPIIKKRVWVGLEEQYTSSRFTQAGQKTEAYAVTNLTVLARDRSERLEASLSIYNLFDERYRDPVSVDLFPLDSVEQAGMTLRAKITYAF